MLKLKNDFYNLLTKLAAFSTERIKFLWKIFTFSKFDFLPLAQMPLPSAPEFLRNRVKNNALESKIINRLIGKNQI